MGKKGVNGCLGHPGLIYKGYASVNLILVRWKWFEWEGMSISEQRSMEKAEKSSNLYVFFAQIF